MTRSMNRLLRTALATFAGLVCLFGSETPSLKDPGSWVTKAQAIIGRPLTPLSYAGVARRTTRRAYWGAGAYGPPVYYGAPVYAAPPVYVAPRPACYQVVNVYDQITYQCP
jgi:hypothetical protein